MPDQKYTEFILKKNIAVKCMKTKRAPKQKIGQIYFLQ